MEDCVQCGNCVFFTPRGTCRVHSARPGQGRDFPLQWRYDDMPAMCAGVMNNERTACDPT